VRVIAGRAKGRILRSPRSRATRPITDRAKESLFAILAPDLAGSSFLDLFAGTGGVGIEALSRGAAHATFVERSARALADIRHNLEITGLRELAEVVGRDVFEYLGQPPRPFDVIFAGPPQWRGLWARTVVTLDRQPGWLADGGVVVAQHDPAEGSALHLARLRLADQRAYGRVCLDFFRAL
jgi:16S rRNA (guanine966-N2)-methyltransferase